MSTRCKACNEELDIITSSQVEGVNIIEDLCSDCLSASMSEWNYAYDHEHVLADAEEGPTPPLHAENT